tara:strand:- start:266 stop:1270 length:1005 start_codon:yes stop_codon:yes gene_type:complete
MNNSLGKKDIKKALSKKKVIVIGDLFLDEYIYGYSNRISPEAPVPVVNFENIKTNLGGAGNVVANLANLNLEVIPISILGFDNISNKIEKFLNKKKISTKGIIKDQNYTGIKKTRVMVKNNQIVRIDYENIKEDISLKYLKKIKKFINKKINSIDFVIISDYGKGFCAKKIVKFVIKLCKSNKVKVLIDPRKKLGDYSTYRNADYISPNLGELRSIYPSLRDENEEIKNKCKELMKKISVKNIIVTRGSKGISFVNQSKFKHLDSDAKEVFDVSGAGDTVISTFSCSLALGLDEISSLKISNKCAGSVISKIGTQPVELNSFVNFYLNENENSY